MIREFTAEEFRTNDGFFVFIKGFEKVTKEVIVNVEYTQRKYAAMIDAGIAKTYIDEENGVFRGAIGFIISNDLHSGEKIAIETFWFVPPEHAGIGGELFKVFEAEAKKAGCKKTAMIHLVDSYPERLKSFYEKNGYRLLESHYIKEV